MENETLRYYDENSEQFAEETFDADIHDIQDRFLCKIRPQGRILDLGCGAGRDAGYFNERGYIVEALDGSKEMCRIARENTGLPVRCMKFEELDDKEVYDGIWACASILHLPKKDLQQMIRQLTDAAVQGGTIYMSFKYGDFEGMKGSRYFTYLTEDMFRRLVSGITTLKIEEMFITGDVRAGRGDEKWLNVIARRI